MKKRKRPHWIRHTHLFDPTEYECSACGTRFSDTAPRCPVCEAILEKTVDSPDWVDEAEELDMILEDD